jgi:hypothetical protein
LQGTDIHEEALANRNAEAAYRFGEWAALALRFSQMNLFVDDKGTQLWQAIRDQDNTISQFRSDLLGVPSTV